jgi:hypothetical protein
MIKIDWNYFNFKYINVLFGNRRMLQLLEDIFACLEKENPTIEDIVKVLKKKGLIRN